MISSDHLKVMTVCNLEYISAIWKKIDLKYMSILTANTIEESLVQLGLVDLELKLMQEFFDNHL